MDAGFREMLEEMNSLLGSGDLPLDLRQKALSLLKAPFELVSRDLDGSSTSGTYQMRIRLNPSDSFLEFLLALRAFKRNLSLAV